MTVSSRVSSTKALCGLNMKMQWHHAGMHSETEQCFVHVMCDSLKLTNGEQVLIKPLHLNSESNDETSSVCRFRLV